MQRSDRFKRRIVRDGNFVAEVEVTLRDDADAWGPTISPQAVFRMDDVRDAMRRKDYATIAKHGKLYRLAPVERPEPSGTDAA